MVVAGFDFGNSAGYIAIARDGGIEVLTNDYSLHATPSCVSFGPKSRSMGYAARQQLSVNFKNTVINFKHLIGRASSDPLLKSFLNYVTCDTVTSDDKIGLKVNYLNEPKVFSPTQIAACFLSKLKQITETATGSKINECVIAVPYFMTTKERAALLASARICGLDMAKIVTDQAAVATAYGIYKGSSLPPPDQPPKYVAFIDAGHSCVQASIMAFNERKVAILGASHDASIGGLFFDDCIRHYFQEEFLTKFKVDAKKNPKAWQRLLDESEKIRKQMSANSTSIPLTIECFMDNVDVSGRMNRAQFEELAAPLFKKIEGVLQRLFESLPDFKVEDVVEVELIGGCSRIPKIKQIVSEFFKRDPMTTMNLDDAIARGCALQAALLSPTVIIKEFVVEDIHDREEVKVAGDITEEIKIEKEMERVDLAQKQRADARNTLEEYCYKVRNQIEEDQMQKLTQEDKDTVTEKTDEMLLWLEEDEDSHKDEYTKRYRQLSTICNPITRKMHKTAKKSEESKVDGGEKRENGEQPTENGDVKPEEQKTQNDSSQPKTNTDTERMDTTEATSPGAATK